MKSILLSLIFITLVYAVGGDTLKYPNAYYELHDGLPFYTDLHYRAPHDSTQRIINGRLGNINVSATAKIDPLKLDTSKTLMNRKVIADTAKFRYLDSIKNAVYIKTDAMKSTYDTITHAKITTLLATTTTLDTATCGGAYFSRSLGMGAVTDKKITLSGSGNNVGIISYNTSAISASKYLDIEVFGQSSPIPLLWNESGMIESTLDSGLYIGAYSSPLRFSTGNRVERMRITNTGNVGIGTKIPNTRLDVNGDFNCWNFTALAHYSSYTNDGVFGGTALPCVIKSYGQSKLLLGYYDNGSGQYQPSIGFAHNSSSYYDLPILRSRVFYGTPETHCRFSITSNGTISWGSGSSDADVNLFRYSPGVLRTSGSIICDGNIAIGTTTFAHKLEVNGSLGSTSFSTSACTTSTLKATSITIGTTTSDSIRATGISITRITADTAKISNGFHAARVKSDGRIWGDTIYANKLKVGSSGSIINNLQYETGSFQCTVKTTDLTTMKIATSYYSKVGNAVTLKFMGTLNGTSNSAYFRIYGLPASLIPTGNNDMTVTFPSGYAFYDNGASFTGPINCKITSGGVDNGVIKLIPATSFWTETGDKGILATVSVTYLLN